MRQEKLTGIQMRAMRDIEATWQGLTFENDFVFGAVLRRDLDLCRRLLEAVLDIPIDHVELVEAQRVTDISLTSKAIRLDVYVADGSGVVYDIEMQRLNATDLPRRARYYQSLLDAEQLDKGASYDALPDTFVIFFCTFDPFRRGLRRYTFRQMCEEDPSILSRDGTERIFLNAFGTKGEVSSDLQSLLQYLGGGYHSDEGLVGDIESAVRDVLASEELRRQFVMLELKMMDERRAAMQEGRAEGFVAGRMEGWEQGLAEGLAEGREEGLAEGIAEGRKRGLAEGREEGLAEGRARAIDLIAALKDALARDGRLDDLLDAIGSQEKLAELASEYGLASIGDVVRP